MTVDVQTEIVIDQPVERVAFADKSALADYLTGGFPVSRPIRTPTGSTFDSPKQIETCPGV